MFKRHIQNFILHFWTPTFILFILSIIFYSALQYYASTALSEAEQAGKVSVALHDRLLALRMMLSGIFCLLMGYMGVKLTGHIWPAVLVHSLVVAGLLVIDLPLTIIISNYDITLLILGAVAGITGLAGALTLGILWLSSRHPKFFRRKKK